MDTTQFAMIEELASLIKDNLYSKHLILSTEEALVNLLHHRYCNDDRAIGNTIELQPASSYNRLLLHRLTDIYGFAHESVGEGDDRHLVLQRCPETAIPPVLVSDVLWEYDDSDGALASVVLSRNGTGKSFFMYLSAVSCTSGIWDNIQAHSAYMEMNEMGRRGRSGLVCYVMELDVHCQAAARMSADLALNILSTDMVAI